MVSIFTLPKDVVWSSQNITMPPKASPACMECKKTESLLWRSVENGQICQNCFEIREAKDNDNVKSIDITDEKKTKGSKDKDSKEDGKSDKKEAIGTLVEDRGTRLRKSTRAARFKARSNASHGNNTNDNGDKSTGTGSGKQQTKARNRRSLFKRTPFKTPLAQAATHSVESIFHKGSYLQVGDIVSLVDNGDNVYYAQIRGLLIDNYCEKSAFLTWLIPTQESPDLKDGFDAATYLMGPDEELSRKLSCLEFVMHAPSNYYLDRWVPDSMEYDTKPGGYIWTTLPEYQRNKTAVEE